MEKPRIIIADRDSAYVVPLQLKFAQDFFGKIDLEIITDQRYFDELFLSPQKADILIVSEELYSSALQRHNIAQIFVTSEQHEEDRTAALNVNYILKYTSIKEIFNEIIGKSGNALNMAKKAKKETQIILIASASGGTGKTTIAMGVSAALTKNYKRVLYVNAARLQSFQYMLDNSSSISTSDVYATLTNGNENAYAGIKHVIRKELFSYLPPFKAALMSLGLNYSIYLDIIQSAKKSEEFDFIIVDADTTFDEDKANLIDAADKVLIITKQNLAAVVATNTMVSNVNGMNGEKYIFICNDFEKENANALISPNITLKFTISDYVDHFSRYEVMSVDDLSKESSIQRVAFLVI